MNISALIESCQAKSPCEVEIRYNESMAEHCTFKAGGPADCFIRPSGAGFPAFIATLISAARADNIPVFFLGGGANILVADKGIRGIVVDTSGWMGETGRSLSDGILEFRAGTSLDSAAKITAEAGLSGLEFLAGMPGTIGGAVWMNARCYGREIADVLCETEIIDCMRGVHTLPLWGKTKGMYPETNTLPKQPTTDRSAAGLVDFSGAKPEILRLPANKSEFGYKFSPFQNRDVLILSAAFQLTPGKDPAQISAEMDTHRTDRTSKGHYRYPSAGSVFKNNPTFGKPSGQIIDELGLCGLRKGGAQVAPWHGNIIINSGGASAEDIRALIDEVSERVKAATGFVLETEVLFVGEWKKPAK